MRIIIDVTETDMEQGKRAKCETCPIALAAKRALPGYACYVFGDSIMVMKGKSKLFVPANAKNIRLPWIARQFIDRFDNNDGPLYPFRFTLEIN